MASYLRGQAAKAANINIETLRYYEKIKLIPVPRRTEKGYRLYQEEVITKLEFIKQAKTLGFSLEEIISMFAISNKRENLNDLTNAIKSKIKEIESEIIKLEKRKVFLIGVADNLNEANDCPLIQYYINL